MMRPVPPHSRRVSAGSRRRGFTLVELMIAVAIVVLLIGLALPVFRVINGSRSQEGASNQIASFLARARTDAIGLQTPTGVAFFQDATGRSLMAEVQQVQFTPWSGTVQYAPGTYVTYVTSAGPPAVVNYYVCTTTVPPAASTSPNANPTSDTGRWSLIGINSNTTSVVNSPGFTFLVDQIPNTDVERLPVGVGTMALSDAGSIGAVVNSQDRYLHVGMMIFDANGRLVTQPFWMSQFGLVGTTSGFKTRAYDICQAQGTRLSGASNLTGTTLASPANSFPCTLYSSVGMVTVDAEAFAAQGPRGDYVIDTSSAVPGVSPYGTSTTAGTKASEDAWLDANGTPLLINRYNGTLLRSE